MKLTELIFYHWKIWMTVPEKTNLWCLSWGWEGSKVSTEMNTWSSDDD